MPTYFVAPRRTKPLLFDFAKPGFLFVSAGCWDLHLNSSAAACLNKNSQVQTMTVLACFPQSKEPVTYMRAALFQLLCKITAQKGVTALKSQKS